MESNHRVVCLEPHKLEHTVVLKLQLENSCGGHRRTGGSCWTAVNAGLFLLLFSFFYGALPALAQTQKGAVEPKRPDYGIESKTKRPLYQIGSAGRFNEDWSSLAGLDLSKTDDFWDRVKYIPLTSDESVWLSIGGQYRGRVEYFDQFQFGNSAPKRSDTYYLSRLRLNTDLHVTPYFRAFIEGRSSLSVDRDLAGRNTSFFYDQVDLMNGFVDFIIPFSKETSLTLRGGRQELIFGSQRLVGPGDFLQVPRAFDGVAPIARIGNWTFTPFWTQVVITDKYEFNKSNTDRQFFGVFSTGPAHILPMNVDLYGLGVNSRGISINGTAGREERYTLGARAWGKIPETNFDFEVEGAGQFGRVGRGNVGAGMFTAVLGYSLPVKRLSPHVYLEFDYASGDKNPGGNVNTFNQLFPNGHAFLGYIDYIGRQNIISSSGGVSVTPVRDLTLTLQQYFFWRATVRDALYNKSGGVLVPGGATRARYVGAETDLLANYNFTRHLLGYVGYSYFYTGEFIDKSGRHKNSNFVYAALQYTF
jgi:Alginate export